MLLEIILHLQQTRNGDEVTNKYCCVVGILTSFKLLLIDLDTFDSGIIFYRPREEFYTENKEDARQRATLSDSPL